MVSEYVILEGQFKYDYLCGFFREISVVGSATWIKIGWFTDNEVIHGYGKLEKIKYGNSIINENYYLYGTLVTEKD